MLGWILYIFFGLILITTCIYLPDMSICENWCCAARTSASSPGSGRWGKKPPKQINKSLNQFSREISGGHSALMVLENMHSGLATLSVSHKPLYNLAKLAANNSKNKFPLVTVSGKKGTAEDLYMTVYIAQALAKENATIIMNGFTSEDSPASQAWQELVKTEVISWNVSDLFQNKEETWVSGKFRKIDVNKAVSEYVYDIIYRYLDLAQSSIRYYVISKEREEELRQVYKNDKSYEVNNITTVFHAAVLKILFPDIIINIVPSTSVIDSVDTDKYEKALTFLTTYIL